MEERPITKEQYERAINERNGYLTEEDEAIVFSQSEICGMEFMEIQHINELMKKLEK